MFKEQKVIRQLLEATDYRDFLRRAFEWKATEKQGFSYAALARKAGFSSRSFPRDVVMGKKRLTYESAVRFADALSLSGDMKSYFMSLVGSEEDIPGGSKQQLSRRLDKIRRRLNPEAPDAEGTAEKLYAGKIGLMVYAALGSAEKGAGLAEVVRRTGLRQEECRDILAEMVTQRIARFDGAIDRYFAQDAHLIFRDLGQSRLFQQWFLESLVEAHQKANREFASEEALFFNSVFSVSRKDMPHFKQELRDLATRFVDVAENQDGDAIATMTIAFYANGN